jgi:hypothetical protein
MFYFQPAKKPEPNPGEKQTTMKENQVLFKNIL